MTELKIKHKQKHSPGTQEHNFTGIHMEGSHSADLYTERGRGSSDGGGGGGSG
jgi:hypothetical protein